MKRALVIGCPGAGKSTFARALRDCTGLPLYYLDQIWHRPDGSSITPQAFDERLAEILARECWIIDGNYLRTLEPRLERCDTVFLLDYPTEVCLAGAAAGCLTYYLLYFTKSLLYDNMLVGGLPLAAAAALLPLKIPASLFNAAAAVVVAPPLCLAIHRALKRAHLSLA